jgi:hypothetical protein
LDRLLAQWTPPEKIMVEMALGLGEHGSYLRVTEPEPHVYVADANAGEALLTAGRADLVYLEGDTVVVLDWKTGKYTPEDPATNLQLWALGIAAGELTRAEHIKVGLYMAQPGTFLWSTDNAKPVARRSLEWSRRFADVQEAARVSAAGTPVPTPDNCRSCWEKRNCEFDCTKVAA